MSEIIQFIFIFISCFFYIHIFSQLSEKERSTTSRIEIARGNVAIEWEGRLMEEMTRLKMELELVHIEDRNFALNELREEHLLENQTLLVKFKETEQALAEQVRIC